MVEKLTVEEFMVEAGTFQAGKTPISLADWRQLLCSILQNPGKTNNSSPCEEFLVVKFTVKEVNIHGGTLEAWKKSFGLKSPGLKC